MKKVTNTYSEPIVLYLLRPKMLMKVEQRTTQNLMPGASVEIGDEEVSPELLHMQKKSRVLIEDVVIQEPEPPPKPSRRRRKPKPIIIEPIEEDEKPEGLLVDDEQSSANGG